MADEGLLDLESREGKAPGGYCTRLPWRGRPFIFMNAVGLPDDVNTLVHEAGHSFHDFASHRQPFIWQRRDGTRGGRAGLDEHGAAGDARTSCSPRATTRPKRPGRWRSSSWRTCWRASCTSPAWMPSSAGSTRAGRAGTRPPATSPGSRCGHASSGAWTGRGSSRSAWRAGTASCTSSSSRSTTSSTASRSWARSRCGGPARQDAAAAIRRYKAALALGGTRPLPDIYAAAGARLVFDAPAMAALVAEVEARIAELREP